MKKKMFFCLVLCFSLICLATFTSCEKEPEIDTNPAPWLLNKTWVGVVTVSAEEYGSVSAPLSFTFNEKEMVMMGEDKLNLKISYITNGDKCDVTFKGPELVDEEIVLEEASFSFIRITDDECKLEGRETYSYYGTDMKVKETINGTLVAKQ